MSGLVSFALTLTTVFPLAPIYSVGATKSDKAVTIRLMKTEGTVTVTDSSSKERSVTEDMRLYDGDHEITDVTSYAWMSLDESKAIKLDEESESEVRKKGKKLEVLLDSGSLFFNVTQPLAEDETLNIRTSTMIAGIRGTCGWVRILDGLTTRVYLLDGKLDCVVTNPVEGSTKTITLTAGQYADFRVYKPDVKGDKCDIIIDKFTKEDIEPYVLIELIGDDNTKRKIKKDSGIDLGGLTSETVKEKLEEKQKKSVSEKELIDEKIKEQDNNISKDKVWKWDETTETKEDQNQDVQETVTEEEPVEEKEETVTEKKTENKPDKKETAEETVSDTVTVTNEEKTEETKDESVVYLTMPQTATTVQSYLNKPAVQKVVLLPGTGDNTLSVDIAFTVPENKTLEASDRVDVRVLQNDSFTVNGTADLKDALANNGTVVVNSANTLRVAKLFTNYGVLDNTSTGRIVLSTGISSSGTFRTAGRIETAGSGIKNLITLNGGNFSIMGGSISSEDCETLIKLSSGASVVFSLTGGTISNSRTGGEALNVLEGEFRLESLGTDINGVSDSLLGTDADYSSYGAGSVWRTDRRYHLVLLKDVESYPVAVAGDIEHGRLEVPSRVEVGAIVPIGVFPDEGYELNTLFVNLYDTDTKTVGEAVTLSDNHEFTMPKNNVIVGGSFKEIKKDEATEEKQDDTTEEKQDDTTEEKQDDTTEEKQDDTTEEKQDDTTEEKQDNTTEEKQDDTTEEKQDDTTEEKQDDTTEEKQDDPTEEEKTVTYNVSFYDEDGTTLFYNTEIDEGEASSYSGNVPSKSATAEYTYTFDGWENGGKLYAPGETLPAAASDMSFTAKFSKTKVSYTVGADTAVTGGSITSDRSTIEWGGTVTVTVTPDDGYDYVNGSFSVRTASGRLIDTAAGDTAGQFTFEMPVENVTVSARFVEEEVPVEYVISFYDDDRTTLLYSYDVPEGEVPSYTGTEPSKTATAEYSYSFAGWISGTATYGTSDAFPQAAADTVYVAVYTETPVSYELAVLSTIKHGTIILPGDTADYGSTVTITVTPDTDYIYRDGSLKVTAGGEEIGTTAGDAQGRFTFVMPAETVSIEAEFDYDGAYQLKATWFEEAGDVEFLFDNSEVTSANAGDMVAVRLTPGDEYQEPLVINDNYDLKKGGTRVTFLQNGEDGLWYFSMPARDVTDIEVNFIYEGTETYQITVTSSPAGIGVGFDISVSGQYGQNVPISFSPGKKISLEISDNGYNVTDFSATYQGGDVTTYDVLSSAYSRYFYMPKGDVSISATFEPKTYSITYDMNAGDDQTAVINDASPASGGTYGADVQLPTDVTRDGYRFTGWYEVDEPDAGDSLLTVIASNNFYDVTLYASWAAVTTLSLPQEPADIQDKLDDPNIAEVILAPGNASNTFELGGQIIIPEGKTLTIGEGVTVIVNEDGSILNLSENTLNNSGIIYIGRQNGIVNGNDDYNPARIVNDGYIFLNSNSQTAIDSYYGSIVNNGTIYYSTGSTIKLADGVRAPEDGIQVLDMGLAGDAIYIRTRIDQTSNYKLDFFGNGEIGDHDDEYHNAEYINGNEKASITELEIHEGITKVGSNAFNIHLTGYNEYYGFTSVVLPDTLKQIGNYAFYNLIRPETITIPDSVTTIGDFAFSRQQDKEDHTTVITLPASLESLGKLAFGYRNVITSIEIPGSLEIISEGAFKGCTSLTTATLNEGVKEVGKEAFYGCTSLTAINLPNGLEVIRETAYYGCTGVSNLVSLPSSVTTIEYDAFTGIPSIHYANQSLPESLTSFDLYFYKGTVLDEIVIPESVTALSGRLREMNNLEKVTVGPNITTVNNRPFDELSGCSGFNTIVFNGTMELWNSDTYRFFRPEQINPNNIYDGYYNRILMTNHVKVICTDGDIQY